MSFPVLIQGPEAEHRNDYAATDQRWALGQKLVTQDGRTYRFHKVGASTLVVGDLLQGPALITNHLATAGVVDGSTAGSSTVVATLGATASAVDQYRGGYASVVLTPGGGETYILNRSPNIQTHAAVASAGVITATLAQGETVVTALTATSDVTWVLNPYAGVIQYPATQGTAAPAGLAVKASTTGRFGWLQTQGVATVLASGTLVVGNDAVHLAASAGVAGPDVTSPAVTTWHVGVVIAVGSTWTVVKLEMEA